MHKTEKDIKRAQKWLRILGSKVKVTGSWSIGMTSAVCNFQNKNSLKATGELDSATWAALKKKIPWWKRYL